MKNKITPYGGRSWHPELEKPEHPNSADIIMSVVMLVLFFGAMVCLFEVI